MTRGSPEASPISFGGPLPCGICAREVPREPVVLATCGHVYCWPCLYRSDPSPTEIASAARALAAPPAAASSRSSFGALPTRRHPPRVESSNPPPGTSSLAPSPESSNRADARLGSVTPKKNPSTPPPRARLLSGISFGSTRTRARRATSRSRARASRRSTRGAGAGKTSARRPRPTRAEVSRRVRRRGGASPLGGGSLRGDPIRATPAGAARGSARRSRWGWGRCSSGSRRWFS